MKIPTTGVRYARTRAGRVIHVTDPDSIYSKCGRRAPKTVPLSVALGWSQRLNRSIKVALCSECLTRVNK